MPDSMTEISTRLSGLKGVTGKQALYLLFESPERGRSICELHDLRFANR